MLKLTRLNRSIVAINPDQILWVEASPDTTLFLTGGDKLIVRETLDELVQEFIDLKRRIHGEPYVLARDLERGPFATSPPPTRKPMSIPHFPSLPAPPHISSMPPASQGPASTRPGSPHPPPPPSGRPTSDPPTMRRRRDEEAT